MLSCRITYCACSSSTQTRDRTLPPAPSTSCASPIIPRTSPSPSPRKQPASPQAIVADSEEFSCHLNISSSHKCTSHTSPRQAHASGKNNKLYNPQTDLIPMWWMADPKVISDATSSSYAPCGSPANPPAHQQDVPMPQRQLFNHWKDDPVQFSILARPSSNGGWPTSTPKSSIDYV